MRKDHLLLFRKYNDDLQVYSYKSNDEQRSFKHDMEIISVFGTFNDISALVFLQVQVSKFAVASAEDTEDLSFSSIWIIE